VPGILEALQWQANRRDEEVMAKREEIIAAVEFAAEEQRSSGLLEAWFGDCAEHVRQARPPHFPWLLALTGVWLLTGGGWFAAFIDGPTGNCHRAS
jgi:hypothetical protein